MENTTNFIKIRELKKVLRSNGQGNMNGKTVSYLFGKKAQKLLF